MFAIRFAIQFHLCKLYAFHSYTKPSYGYSNLCCSVAVNNAKDKFPTTNKYTSNSTDRNAYTLYASHPWPYDHPVPWYVIGFRDDFTRPHWPIQPSQ